MISDDTINWKTGLNFRLSNQKEVTEIDSETDEEVVVQEAGPLNNLEFWFNPTQMSEINGRVYVPASINISSLPERDRTRGLGIVYTDDLENWYLANEDFNDDHFLGPEANLFSNSFSNATDTTAENYGHSNIIKHNDEYIFIHARDLSFMKSNDLVTWEKVTPNNRPIIRELNDQFNISTKNTSNIRCWNCYRIKSINSVIVSSVEQYSITTSNNTNRIVSSWFYTSNLTELNIPSANGTTQRSNTDVSGTTSNTNFFENRSTNARHNFMHIKIHYVNGYLIIGGSIFLFNTKILTDGTGTQNPRNLLPSSQRLQNQVKNTVVFNGEIYYAIDSELRKTPKGNEDNPFRTSPLVDVNGEDIHCICGVQ